MGKAIEVPFALESQMNGKRLSSGFKKDQYKENGKRLDFNQNCSRKSDYRGGDVIAGV